MLKNPVRFADLISKISPEEFFEFKQSLERRGEKVQFIYDYEAEKVWGEYARCIGCGLYFEWHELNLRGGKPNDRRNTCRDCYPYYHLATKAKQYKPLKKHSAKERQRRLAHELYGGWFWSYMIRTTYKEMLALYFGATDNIISRERQHYSASSNPHVQDLFADKKQVIIDNLFAFVKPITFTPFPHETIEEAYRHERELWDYWTQRDDVLVLNVNAPSGAPPVKNAA